VSQTISAIATLSIHVNWPRFMQLLPATASWT